MRANAYIVALPRSTKIGQILYNKPELRTYIYDEESSYKLSEILQELKDNIEIDITGELERMAILYYIIEYATEHNQLLGNIKIPGKIEKIINVEAKNIKESTRHHILQNGLLDGLMRRVLDGV